MRKAASNCRRRSRRPASICAYATPTSRRCSAPARPTSRLENVNLSSRVGLSGNRLTFDDLDGTAAGSHLRGHLAMTLDQEKSVDGEIGLDTLDLVPALAMAIGAAGRDAAEPLGAGLVSGWRGRIAFQALRGTLPGGIELRPIGGTIRSDGQLLAFDAAARAALAAARCRQASMRGMAPNGLALNARVSNSPMSMPRRCATAISLCRRGAPRCRWR